MVCRNENTVVELLAPVHGDSEQRDRRHLQMSCKVISSYNPNKPSSVVSVVGNVDCTTSRELLAEIKELLTTDHPARLILDLKGVTHIDSSGVGTLVEGLHDAKRRHVCFRLSGLNDSLRHMLERMHLSILFDIRPTVEEALQN